MARRWLSYWNQETRRAQRVSGVAHSSDADIWVPYGFGRIAVGDVVYCVAIERGQLLLFGKLAAGRIALDRDNAESVDVWAKRGSDAWCDPPATVGASAVDGLRFLKEDGTEDGFKRSRAGVAGNAFQGRASMRELVAGHEGFDRLL